MRRLLLGAMLVGIAACSTDVPPEDDPSEVSEDALSAGFQSIGLGVAYKRIESSGDAVFIGYGGYSVQLDWSCKWTDELHRAKLKDLGVGHLYAVKGPNDPGYAAREVANTALGAHLRNGAGPNAPFVLIAAHSSGAFVAHELLDQLTDRGASTAALRSKIVYVNLDGGGSGFNGTIESSLRHSAFVWAQDPGLGSGRSSNASTMIALGNAYGSPAIRLDVPQSGCFSGAKWCLHDLVITTRPHNPATFDLRRDYSNFIGRPVQTKWIEPLLPHLEDAPP